MIGLFAQAADVIVQQPAVSDNIGWGMVIITGLTMVKQTVTEIIGYFTKKNETSTKLALLEAEHATCKQRTDELEKTCKKQDEQIMTLNIEVGVLKSKVDDGKLAESKPTT